MSDSSLRRHIDVHRPNYKKPNTTPDPDLTFYSRPQALTTITVKVCYHGDLWLKAHRPGGPRSQGLTPLLSRIIFELALKTWEPNYVFALVPKQLVTKGAHLRYGYILCEPGVWHGPDKKVTDEDWLNWMSARDIAKFLDTEPQSLQKQSQVSTVNSTVRSIDTKG